MESDFKEVNSSTKHVRKPKGVTPQKIRETPNEVQAKKWWKPEAGGGQGGGQEDTWLGYCLQKYLADDPLETHTQMLTHTHTLYFRVGICDKEYPFPREAMLGAEGQALGDRQRNRNC